MYTEEKLLSQEFLRLYMFVGRNSLKSLNKVETLLSKRKEKKELNIELGKERFNLKDNVMHYTNVIQLNDNGTYLISDVTKEIDTSLLNISLELGVEGYDLSTGEKYNRKQGKVEYTYENDILMIKKIEDENFYNSIEEKRNNDTLKKVLSQKK